MFIHHCYFKAKEKKSEWILNSFTSKGVFGLATLFLGSSNKYMDVKFMVVGCSSAENHFRKNKNTEFSLTIKTKENS